VATLTVRNLPDDAKHRFRQIAAAHGRSMEEHLRQLVIDADFGTPAAHGVGDVNPSFRHFRSAAPDLRAESRLRIEQLIKLGRGLDFEPPPRDFEPLREIDFG
jgi:hypothetical protein